MFPIVPQNFDVKSHNFSSPEVITSFVTGSSKLLVPGKVTAFTTIPQGAVSAPIEAAQLLGQPDVVQVSFTTTISTLIFFLFSFCINIFCSFKVVLNQTSFSKLEF
jgi:hypothetical protein